MQCHIYAAVAARMVGDLAVKGNIAGRGLEGDLAVMLPAVAGRTLGDIAVKLPAVVCRRDDGTTISCIAKSSFMWPTIGRVSSDLGDILLGLCPGTTPRDRPRDRELLSRPWSGS